MEKYEVERMEKEKLAQECVELKTTVTSKEKDLEALQREKEEAEKMNETLICDKEAILEEKEQLEDQVREIKNNLVNLKESYEELTTKFESCISENTMLVKSLDNLQAELSESNQCNQSNNGEPITNFFEKLDDLNEIEIMSNDESRVYKKETLPPNQCSHLRMLIQDFVNVKQSSSTLTGEKYVISGQIERIPFSIVEMTTTTADEPTDHKENDQNAINIKTEGIESLTAERDSLNAECSNWQSKYEDCLRDVESSKLTIKELMEKREAQEKAFTQIVTECDEWKIKYEECFDSFKLTKLQVEELQKLLENTDQITKELQFKCESDESKINALENQFRMSKEFTENLEDQFNSLKEDMDANFFEKEHFEDQIRDLSKEIEELNEQVKLLESKSLDLEALVSQKSDELKASFILIDETKTQLSAKNEEFLVSNKLLEQFKKSFDVAQQKTVELFAITDLLESELQLKCDLLAQSERRDEELQTTSNEFQAKEESYEKSLKEAEEKIDSLNLQIDDQKMKISDYEEELKSEAMRFKEKYDEIRVSLSSQAAEIDSLQKESLSNLLKWQDLQLHNKYLNEDVENYKSARDALEQALIDKQKEFDEIAEKVLQMESMEKELVSFVFVFKFIIAILLIHFQMILNAEKEEFQHLETTFKNLEISYKRLEESKQKLQQELSEKDDNIKYLEKKIEDLQTTKMSIESKMNTAEHSFIQQIKALRNENETFAGRYSSPSESSSHSNSPKKTKHLGDNDVSKVSCKHLKKIVL